MSGWWDPVISPSFKIRNTRKFSCYDKNSSRRILSNVLVNYECMYTNKILQGCVYRRPWCVTIPNDNIAEISSLVQLCDFESTKW